MSISRTISLGALCSALTITVIGWASPATAKPLWCEPGAPYGCSQWHAGAGQVTDRTISESPAGMTTGQYFKLLDDRRL